MYGRTGFFRITGSDHFKTIYNMSSFITLTVYLSLFVDGNFQPLRKCIYYRCTYTMKTTGHFVSATTKLSSRMQNCKNQKEQANLTSV